MQTYFTIWGARTPLTYCICLHVQGMRSMPYWRYGGVAALNEHFLRLTPDRQGKSGYVQSTQANTADAWSSTFKFRVSGQGRKLFGDGIALWFTTQPGFRSGDLHGFTDMFTGFGVIFDSYINNEPGRVHRDVLFLSSDGSSSRKAAGEHGGGNVPDPIGCAADFRYWEGRDDFSVRNASLARLTFANNKVSVHIDAHADGNWKACFEVRSTGCCLQSITHYSFLPYAHCDMSHALVYLSYTSQLYPSDLDPPPASGTQRMVLYSVPPLLAERPCGGAERLVAKWWLHGHFRVHG